MTRARPPSRWQGPSVVGALEVEPIGERIPDARSAPIVSDTSGLDPVKDRQTIADRLRQSRVGALLEYLKTL